METRLFRRQKADALKYINKLFQDFNTTFIRNSYNDKGVLKYYAIVDETINIHDLRWRNYCHKISANRKKVLSLNLNEFKEHAEKRIEDFRVSYYCRFLQLHLEEKYGHYLTMDEVKLFYDRKTDPREKAIEIIANIPVSCAA